MKYSTRVEINLPRARVIELFDSTENLAKWQPTLVSFEHESGDPGQDGATSKLVYKMGKREMEMLETIVKNGFPDEFLCTYDAKGVVNKCDNRFEAIGDDKTRWTQDNEFQCKGFMRIMAFLMPWAFKKETLKAMKRFKEFAETA